MAIKSAPNLSQAAARLGIALVSLSRWADRRGREAVFRDVARLEHEDEAAIDEYRIPSSVDRREFHRVHPLVGDTAEKAVALVELAEGLTKAFMPRGEADRRDP